MAGPWQRVLEPFVIIALLKMKEKSSRINERETFMIPHVDTACLQCVNLVNTLVQVHRKMIKVSISVRRRRGRNKREWRTTNKMAMNAKGSNRKKDYQYDQYNITTLLTQHNLSIYTGKSSLLWAPRLSLRASADTIVCVAWVNKFSNSNVSIKSVFLRAQTTLFVCQDGMCEATETPQFHRHLRVVEGGVNEVLLTRHP